MRLAVGKEKSRAAPPHGFNSKYFYSLRFVASHQPRFVHCFSWYIVINAVALLSGLCCPWTRRLRALGRGLWKRGGIKRTKDLCDCRAQMPGNIGKRIDAGAGFP